MGDRRAITQVHDTVVPVQTDINIFHYFTRFVEAMYAHIDPAYDILCSQGEVSDILDCLVKRGFHKVMHVSAVNGEMHAY